MKAAVGGDSWSFRDPMGSVIVMDGRVFRIIRKPYGAVALRFMDSAFFIRRCATGSFPETQITRELPDRLIKLTESNRPECILEHRRIHFPVYPHEWTPNMLYDAGQLTLNLAEEALAEGWMLKDATPWNVLFSDGRPVFCDVLSFEPRGASGIWNAYAQFQRTFVLPLYAHKRHAWPVHSIFLDQREGIDPSVLAPAIRGWRRWAPLELQTIILPAKLSHRPVVQDNRAVVETSVKNEAYNQQLADFVLRRSFRRLRNQLDAVRPHGEGVTQWTHYEKDLQHYSDEDHEIKFNFVRAALSKAGTGRVLDIGANSGEYSLMAAAQGASVVAADFDVSAIDKLYGRAKAGRLPITPMVLNIARPTPAVGWDNQEVDSFLVRARGQFRMVMVLALLHHLIVTERVPLEFVVRLLFDLEAPFLLIEWVSPSDSRFRQIASTHGDLYANLSDATFERALERHFCIVERMPVSKTRKLYLCERRGTVCTSEDWHGESGIEYNTFATVAQA